ncbi:MAG: hypothetical protein GY747_04015 [Planctomycetes bacterium]|nr:hypothetical protein [Planctomycetota bacterium]MCP4771919.1 hypothetical protein [Planctomycetota bacterium]MCP4859964.1 hypothetical protein [Planctomycetota bacterium]
MVRRPPPKAPKKKRPKRLKDSSRGQLKRMRAPTAVLTHATRAHYFGYAFGYCAGSVGFVFMLRILNNNPNELEVYLNYWVIKLLGNFMLGMFLSLVPTVVFRYSARETLAKIKVIDKVGKTPGHGGFVAGLGASGAMAFLAAKLPVALFIAVVVSLAVPPLTAWWWADDERKKRARKV